MELKTKVGTIKIRTPLRVSERAKFWAGALHEVVRLDELYAVVQTMLEEAYEAGRSSALDALLRGWATKLNSKPIDVEFKVLENDEKRSPVEGDSEELLHERELASAESVGSAASEADVPRPAPVSQADGFAGTPPGTDGETCCGPQHHIPASEGKACCTTRQAYASGSSFRSTAEGTDSL